MSTQEFNRRTVDPAADEMQPLSIANDDELMEAAATARILMNKEIYCDSYVNLFKAKK